MTMNNKINSLPQSIIENKIKSMSDRELLESIYYKIMSNDYNNSPKATNVSDIPICPPKDILW